MLAGVLTEAHNPTALFDAQAVEFDPVREDDDDIIESTTMSYAAVFLE